MQSVRAVAIAPLLVLPLVAGGCLEPGSADPPEAGIPIPFRTLLSSSNAEVVEGAMTRSLTLAEWDVAWERYARSQEPRPEKPPVDATRERVVAVALGQRGSGCHDVRIVDVARASEEARVAYEVLDGEAAGQICTAQVVWPTHVVAIEETRAPLRFEARAWSPEGAPAPAARRST